MLGLFFDPEDRGNTLFETLTFNGVHSVMSQTTELFIITTVENPES
jgi:hypothetical protein